MESLVQRDLNVWQELIDGIFGEIEVRPSRDENFAGSLKTCAFGALTITEVHTVPAMAAHWVPSKSRRLGRERFYLTLTKRGHVKFGDSKPETPNGSMTLVNSRRAYSCHLAPQVENLVITFPGALLRTVVPNISRIASRPSQHEGGMIDILLNFSDRILRNESVLRQGEKKALQDQLLTLSGLALGGEEPVERSGRQADLMVETICDYLRTYLSDPGLNPRTIAHFFNISPRHLHSLFQETGRSVGRRILDMRLECCSNDLASADLARSRISEIALQWGFNSMPHFSRTFTQRFGITPSEFRRLALAGEQ